MGWGYVSENGIADGAWTVRRDDDEGDVRRNPTAGRTVIWPASSLLRGDTPPFLDTLILRIIVHLFLDPRRETTGLASGMSELDTDERALGVAEIDNSFEWGNVRVVPDAGIFGGDLSGDM